MSISTSQNSFTPRATALHAALLIAFMCAQASDATACSAAPASLTHPADVIVNDPTKPEVDQIVLGSLATGKPDKFALGLAGSQTPRLSFGANPAAVGAALNALGAGTTFLVDTSMPDYVVQFADPSVRGPLTVGEYYLECQQITFGSAPTITAGSSGQVSATTTATPAANYPITFSTGSTDCSVSPSGLVTGITAGTNNCIVDATQTGDNSYASASASLTISIAAASLPVPDMTVDATPNPVVAGSIVTFSSTLGGTAQEPTGVVTFCSNATSSYTCAGGTIICTGPLIPNGSTSSASCTASFAAAGMYNITAIYAGDANNSNTATRALPLTVTAPAPPPPPAAVAVPTLNALALMLLGGVLTLMAALAGRHR